MTRGARGDLARMRTLLAQEHAALLRADFARLEAMAPRKVALLSRLESALADDGLAALAGQVRSAAARNAALYESAIAGVREAIALLTHARNPPAGRIYGRNGHRQALEVPVATLERRA